MQILNGRRHRIQELVFSHCGRWLAASGSTGGLHIWDTTNPAAPPKRMPALQVRPRSWNLTFRADGRAFCSSWATWFLADPLTGTARRIANQKYGTYQVSSDGTRVVRAHQSTPLRSFRVSGEKVTAGPTVSVARTYFGNVAFVPGGNSFAVEEVMLDGTFPTKRRLTLRSIETLKLNSEFPTVWETSAALLFSTNGSRVIGRNGASLVRWTVAEPGKAPRKCSNPGRKYFLSMACHPEEKLLTVDNDRLVRVWDLATMSVERTIEWKIGKLYAVAVSPDGARAAVGSHTGKVLVWDWD